VRLSRTRCVKQCRRRDVSHQLTNVNCVKLWHRVMSRGPCRGNRVSTPVLAGVTLGFTIGPSSTLPSASLPPGGRASLGIGR
jgi:hypothetical protein